MTDRISPTELGRVHDVLASPVEAGRMPGLVALVATGDEVHVDVIGRPAFDAASVLGRDAIFRIASLTKPITAVTALALVEDGTLTLEQPIDVLVPELADRRVLRDPNGPIGATVPAKRAITVEDLLTFRSGMGSPMVAPSSTPLMRAEAELDLKSIGGPPWPPTRHDVDGWIAALGTLPWIAQPGERWLYNTSAQILGVVIARATGSPLESVMRERVFDACGMVDTSFSVDDARRSRLTTAYGTNPATGERCVNDTPASSHWSSMPSFADASGMLTSTIDDYWRFVSMVLADGDAPGSRVLQKATVAAMTTDHLTPEQRDAAAPFLGGPDSWGLGLLVPSDTPAGRTAPFPTGIGWDGGSGCTWRSSLRTGVTGILLTQRETDSPEPPAVFLDFWATLNTFGATQAQ
jgi:CubicO group peptidase (beta-lactamase class C family)